MGERADGMLAVNSNRLNAQRSEAIYDRLFAEIGMLHQKWADYVALFGVSERRVELLNAASPALARRLQDVLWNDIMLHMARLHEPARVKGKPVLSLCAYVETISDDEAKRVIEKAREKAKQDAKFCRNWRDNVLAHSNLDLHLAPAPAQKLEEASRKKMKQALASLAHFMDVVSQRKNNTNVLFEVPGNDGDAVALLTVVRDGLRAYNARIERVNSGCPLPEDLTCDDPI